MREVIVMTTHNDLAVAFEEQRKRREAHAAAWARNFDRHTRRFERHAPPGPNRIARRAHLQPDAAPAEPFSSEKQRSMMARLTDFFLPGTRTWRLNRSRCTASASTPRRSRCCCARCVTSTGGC